MVMGPIVPVLRILDEDKAREFYLDYLGFEIVFEHRFEDNAPLYMGIIREGCTIHLSEHHGDCIPGASIRINTDNIEAYHQELAAKKYKYANPGIEKMPWGSHEFRLTDPFGNNITFTTPIK